jgi:H+/gluconate symporter-like permease
MAFSNIVAKWSPFIALTAIAVSFGLSKGMANAAARILVDKGWRELR